MFCATAGPRSTGASQLAAAPCYLQPRTRLRLLLLLLLGGLRGCPASLPSRSRLPTGQSWKEVRHDKTVTWLAYWRDPVNTKDSKYVFLAPNSVWKSEGDLQK